MDLQIGTNVLEAHTASITSNIFIREDGTHLKVHMASQLIRLITINVSMLPTYTYSRTVITFKL
jgi:hypothetical protein